MKREVDEGKKARERKRGKQKQDRRKEIIGGGREGWKGGKVE